MTLPAQVLDLSRWKLTLPIGQAEKPTEIKWPVLGTYQHSEFFTVEPGGGVRFRAPINGVTTSGSKNPRCELREMNADGSNASWSSSKGAHELAVLEAFTHLPNPRTDGGNAGVVGAQIHDASDDISVFRLEGAKLWVTRGDDTHYALATDNYALGQVYEAKFVVWQDKVKAYYNGRLVTTIPGKFSGAYFKAGCYTQANAKNSKPADASNYGEVRILSVSVLHTATPLTDPVQPPPTPDPDPTAPDATVIVIRHAEKPPDSGPPYGLTEAGSRDEHCLTTHGWRRAGALVPFFAGTPLGAVYASMGTSKSRRPYQTVLDVARGHGLPVISRYDLESKTEFTAMVAEIQARAGTTLVCGEHSQLPNFVRALSGLAVPDWPEDRFDVCLWLGRLNGAWSMLQIPQLLRPGDRSAPIT